MNQEELETKLDETRERLLVAIDPLSDEALLAPGAVGDWSVRDLLVHLTTWEAELVTGLMHLDQKKKPRRLLAALANRQEYNDQRLQENRDRDLDRVFDDLIQVRRQLERWIDHFAGKALSKKGHFAALGGEALATFIARYSCDHEAEHIAAVAAFADRWLADEAAVAAYARQFEDEADRPAPAIDLNDIEVLPHDE